MATATRTSGSGRWDAFAAPGTPAFLIATDVAARGIHVDDVVPGRASSTRRTTTRTICTVRAGRRRAGASGMVIALVERAASLREPPGGCTTRRASPPPATRFAAGDQRGAADRRVGARPFRPHLETAGPGRGPAFGAESPPAAGAFPPQGATAPRSAGPSANPPTARAVAGRVGWRAPGTVQRPPGRFASRPAAGRTLAAALPVGATSGRCFRAPPTPGRRLPERTPALPVTRKPVQPRSRPEHSADRLTLGTGPGPAPW